jgi:hypothetical protein
MRVRQYIGTVKIQTKIVQMNNYRQLRYLQGSDVHHVIDRSHIFDLYNDVLIRCDSLVFSAPLLRW